MHILCIKVDVRHGGCYHNRWSFRVIFSQPITQCFFGNIFSWCCSSHFTIEFKLEWFNCNRSSAIRTYVFPKRCYNVGKCYHDYCKVYCSSDIRYKWLFTTKINHQWMETSRGYWIIYSTSKSFRNDCLFFLHQQDFYVRSVVSFVQSMIFLVLIIVLTY